MRLYRLVLIIQACYFLMTALWPLVHIDSFLKVTGPKTDIWLVKTVAALLLAISVSFIAALLYKVYDRPIMTLAMSSCMVLIVIDCFYVWNGTISKIYLLDALLELCLLILWVIVIFRNNTRYRRHS